MSGKAVLRVPRTPHPPSGDATITRPWFAHARLSGRPLITTFVGTDEIFIDAFFRGVESSGEGFSKGAFPGLLPARDYAEPPRALLDGAGQPIYFREHVEPKTTERPADDELDLGGKSSFAAVLVDAGVAKDEAAVLDKVYPTDETSAGWLRKLYLPMHTHFHVVACDLVCKRPHSPRIDGKRVMDSGLVVRRFVPDTTVDENGKPLPARWEDWIPSPLGGGIWAEIADGDMRTLAGKTPIDPVAILRVDLGANEAEILGRLGIDVEKKPDVKLSLATAPLAPLPGTIAEGLRHTTRYGYLPVAMGDKERGEPESGKTAEEIGEILATAAEAHLTAQIVAPADAIRARVRGAVSPLLTELQGTLPDRPDPWAEFFAAFWLVWKYGLSGSDLMTAAANLGLATLSSYSDALFTDTDRAARFRGALYQEVYLIAKGASLTPPRTPPSGTAALAAIAAGATAPGAGGADSTENVSLATLALAAVHRAFDAVFPSGALADTVEPRILAALVLLIRRHRVRCLNAFYEKAFTDEATRPDPDAYEPDPMTEVDPNRDWAPLRAPMTCGAVGSELSGWIAANDARGVTPVDWDPPATSNDPSTQPPETPLNLWIRSVNIHAAATALEQALMDVHAQGAGAGGAYAVEIQSLVNAADGALRTALGHPPLAQRGLDLHAQPELGLFAFPGPSPQKSDLEAFVAKVKGHYEGPARDPDAMIRAEESAKSQLIRPRFDPDHLYAVHCYARVASRDKCGAPEIVWSKRTEVFSLAEPMDLLGLKPVPIRLPDLPKMIRDIPRMRPARALPFAAITTPSDSGVKTGDDPKKTAREWGIAWICSFAIPVFTICAWILFQIIFSILLILPGFAWMLLLKFCIPVPAPKKL